MNRSIIWIIAMLFCAMFWAIVFYPFIVHAQPAPGPVIDRADQVSTDTSSFNNNLSSSDNTVQKALDTIDNMSVSGVGSATLDGLTDVAISSASSAQLLINDGAGQFRNRTLSGAVSIGTTGVASITGYVPTTTTVNGQALSSDVTITPTTLSLLIGTNTQAYDADLDYLSGFTPAANIKSILNAADYSAVRSLLGLVIGTNVQAYDADLTTYAGIAPSANIQTFLGSADNSAARTNLGLGSLATQSGTFSGTSSGTNTGDQTSVSGNAGTATALAADPTACGDGDFVNDIAANGTLTCGTPSGGGGVGIGTVNPGTTNAFAKYVGSTTLGSSLTLFEVNGNIGIGTTTPFSDTKLTVKGGASTGTDDFIGLFVQNGITPEAVSTANTAHRSITVQGDSGAYVIGRDVTNDIEFAMGTSILGVGFGGTITTHPFQIRTTNTARIQVGTDGNVGIGTINPNARLTVMGTGTGATPILTLRNSGSTQRMVVMDNGTVGIGTAAPGNALDVVGIMSATTVTGANVTSGANPGHTHTTSSVSGIDISDDTNLAGTANEVVLTGDTLSLADAVKGWIDGGTNIYNATSTDAVGIGTTTPKSGFEFDLRGDQYVSGNVGIGTTTVPSVPLYVGGAIKTSEIQGTSAAGTPFTITQANIGIGTAAAGAAVVIGNSPSHTTVGMCIGTGGCVGYCTGVLGTCSACTCLTTQ